MRRTCPKFPCAPSRLVAGGFVGWLLFATEVVHAQTVTVDATKRYQTIDGFGTCLSGKQGELDWFKQLYFEDLKSSILRFDITPTFKSPYSDYAYNSPWFHNNPGIDSDANRVREYQNATDYTTAYAGRSAQIAVMGPNIDENVKYFDFAAEMPRVAGALAKLGQSKRADLGDFKLFASMWSPAPWLKISSGNKIADEGWPLPAGGAPWPFIWGGNFAGGKLDVSETPLAVFDDSSVGGTGPTSALTQFARGLAAYLRGFQNMSGVRLYAISIQNELNFEVFYNSCTYPLAEMYIKALKAARAELDKYDDLKGIRITGPEDLLGGDAYGMWEYGGSTGVIHKNLQYLQQIAADAKAAAALDFFCIHGYAPDGVSSAGADPRQWRWWADGWTSAPAAGLPTSVKGFQGYAKKSWMTETSGEPSPWLAPATGFPNSGAFSMTIKIHQALTVGAESAWIYWQLTDDDDKPKDSAVTDSKLRDKAPKYVALKHFFRPVRPNSVRIEATVAGANALYASAFVHDTDRTLAVVIINASSTSTQVAIKLPAFPASLGAFAAHTSSDGKYWESSSPTATDGQVSVTVPGYGVVSLLGRGEGGANGADGGGAGGASGGASGGSGSGSGGAGGSPTRTCDAGQSQCGSECVDLASNRRHCGVCDRGCANGETCSAGTCRPDGAPAPSASRPGKESGCGCHTLSGGPDEVAIWVLLVLGAFAVRRREFYR